MVIVEFGKWIASGRVLVTLPAAWLGHTIPEASAKREPDEHRWQTLGVKVSDWSATYHNNAVRAREHNIICGSGTGLTSGPETSRTPLQSPQVGCTVVQRNGTAGVA